MLFLLLFTVTILSRYEYAFTCYDWLINEHWTCSIIYGIKWFLIWNDFSWKEICEKVCFIHSFSCQRWNRIIYIIKLFAHIFVGIYISFSWPNGWTNLADIFFMEPMGTSGLTRGTPGTKASRKHIDVLKIIQENIIISL